MPKFDYKGNYIILKAGILKQQTPHTRVRRMLLQIYQSLLFLSLDFFLVSGLVFFCLTRFLPRMIDVGPWSYFGRRSCVVAIICFVTPPIFFSPIFHWRYYEPSRINRTVLWCYSKWCTPSHYLLLFIGGRASSWHRAMLMARSSQSGSPPSCSRSLR